MKIAMASICALILTLPIFSGSAEAGRAMGRYFSVAEPRLIYPINDTVDLSAKENLEFQWWNDTTTTRSFILKVYKGYNMYGADLLYKETLSANLSSFKIKAEAFTEGQVYTWSLVRVGFDGQKSDKSFNSFKVIKK